MNAWSGTGNQTSSDKMTQVFDDANNRGVPVVVVGRKSAAEAHALLACVLAHALPSIP
jgi:hypothetical protein